MSIDTLCQVCQAESADHRCLRCGAMVCADHYDDSKGLCQGCVVGREADD